MTPTGTPIDRNWLSTQFPTLTNLQPLSQGGQKLVFSATHTSEGEVVLKLIQPTQSAERTNREPLAVTQLNAPRVPRILEQGTLPTQVGNCLWFLEQRIIGQPLDEVLKRAALDPTCLLRLALHITETLLVAEQVSIVHRDVKPKNIIMSTTGDFWLIDFGLARHLTLDSLTATASPWGLFTIGYAPPEQYRNFKQDIDSRADLFALGVTLYEAATGSNPYTSGARDGLEIVRRIETPNFLPRLNLPLKSAGQFADLVQALTQRRRDHRPATVQEVFDWIGEICKAETT